MSIDFSLFSNIAKAVMDNPAVRSSRLGLGMKRFQSAGRNIVAIQQNPAKGSEWAKLAREGHQVVQFRDMASDRYVAVSVDGKVQEYGPRPVINPTKPPHPGSES